MQVLEAPLNSGNPLPGRLAPNRGNEGWHVHNLSFGVGRSECGAASPKLLKGLTKSEAGRPKYGKARPKSGLMTGRLPPKLRHHSSIGLVSLLTLPPQINRDNLPRLHHGTHATQVSPSTFRVARRNFGMARPNLWTGRHKSGTSRSKTALAARFATGHSCV